MAGLRLALISPSRAVTVILFLLTLIKSEFSIGIIDAINTMYQSKDNYHFTEYKYGPYYKIELDGLTGEFQKSLKICFQSFWYILVFQFL